MAIVFVFIDGIGLGPAGEANPFSRGTAFLDGILPAPGLTADLFAGTGGTSLEIPWTAGGKGVLASLDARLGVAGLPQSATGQTTLFTGLNAPQSLGHHLSGFPTPTLLHMLGIASVFKRAREAGRRVTFANPFPPGYFEAVASRRRRHATTTAAILAAGASLRSFRDLEQGRAVSHDLTGQSLRERGFSVPRVEPEEAGRRLARLAAEYDLVLFEYFLTDRAGHKQDMTAALTCLDQLGRFLAALMAELDFQRDTFLLVSDHGNMEDLSVPTHTIHPVPALALGARAHLWQGARSLTDVAPALLHSLDVPLPAALAH